MIDHRSCTDILYVVQNFLRQLLCSYANNAPIGLFKIRKLYKKGHFFECCLEVEHNFLWPIYSEVQCFSNAYVNDHFG